MIMMITDSISNYIVADDHKQNALYNKRSLIGQKVKFKLKPDIFNLLHDFDPREGFISSSDPEVI
jgi:hypothetical protein